MLSFLLFSYFLLCFVFGVAGLFYGAITAEVCGDKPQDWKILCSAGGLGFGMIAGIVILFVSCEYRLSSWYVAALLWLAAALAPIIVPAAIHIGQLALLLLLRLVICLNRSADRTGRLARRLRDIVLGMIGDSK